MKNITDREFISSIVTIINASILLTVFSFSITTHETWIVIIAAIIVSVAATLIYTSLIKRFPGQSLTEMTIIVFGKYLGTVLSIIYILFFLFLTSMGVHDLIIYFNGYILPETPLWVLASLFILTCTFAVFKGIHNIVRLCFIMLILYFAVIILNTLLLIKEMDISHFLPLFVHSPKEYLQCTALTTTIPMCETVAIIMLAPFLSKPQNCRKPFITGILLGGFILLILVCRDTAVLGSLLSYLSLPSYEAVRMVNVLDIFTRLEVLYGFILIIEYFSKASLFYWITVFGAQKLLKVKKPTLIIIIVGIAIFLISTNIFQSEGQETSWSKNWGPIVLGFFEILIPLVMLITAAIRKKSTKIE